jgi:transposase
VQWRSNDDLPPAALLIQSPYDVEARFGVKRTTTWTGYVRRVGADEIPA